MAKLSTGGFIVLPGGYGTLEEALEMITWNQLGIHRLPIIILNIGNFFTHLYKQFENSVEAGFIAPSNLSLLRLVDLEGGEEANIDETRADEWGQAALKALKEWSVDVSHFRWTGSCSRSCLLAGGCRIQFKLERRR